jgi:hypothetical protein
MALSVRLKNLIFNWSSKWTGLTQKKNRGTNLVTKVLKVRNMSRCKILSPWPTDLHFKTKIFKPVWPPLQ